MQVQLENAPKLNGDLQRKALDLALLLSCLSTFLLRLWIQMFLHVKGVFSIRIIFGLRIVYPAGKQEPSASSRQQGGTSGTHVSGSCIGMGSQLTPSVVQMAHALSEGK